MSMLPFHLENVLFLFFNQSLWSLEDVANIYTHDPEDDVVDAVDDVEVNSSDDEDADYL